MPGQGTILPITFHSACKAGE